jgi:hypothetical protein
VRVTWSTGSPVVREDMRGRYTERLSMDPAHLRMDRLQGASVLDNHNRFSGVRGVLGVVRSADVANGVGTAELQFSTRADVEPIWQDVAAGIIRNVSVGYSVQKWREDTDANTGARTRTAIDWTPQEISFVPLAADPGARVRSAAVEPTNDQDGTRAEINQSIRTVARVAGLPATFADALIDRGASVKQARAAAFKELQKAAADGQVILSQRIEPGFSHDDPAVLRGRMAEALACRVIPGSKPSEPARQFMSLGMLDMARMLLEARSERTSLMAREEIINAALQTRAIGPGATLSDFADLLTLTGNRVLLAAYQHAPNPLKQLAGQTTMPDFRPRYVLCVSDMPKLLPVTEQGEINHVARTEAMETYSLQTFGQIFSLSRKAIINDDLNAFSDWSNAMGRAAAETEAAQLIALLAANSNAGATMQDGNALFHSAHGNLATSGAPISVTTLSAGRLAMRRQKDIDGVTPINATGAFLLVPPEQETLADQVLTEIMATTTAAVNPFVGALSKLVEARLSSTTAWYLFSDPGVLPVLECGYLASAQGPQMASRQGWEVLGVEFRCMLDFGCAAIDHRGAYLNPGA